MVPSQLGVILLALCIAASLASNAAYGSTIGSVSAQHAAAITPASSAFAIWGVIYAVLAVGVVVQIRTPLPPPSNVFMALSFVLVALWVPVFVANTPRSIVVSGMLLALASTCAMMAIVSGQCWTNETSASSLLVDTGFSLYTGWLIVATGLSVGVAVEKYGVSVPLEFLFIPVFVGLVFAIGVGDPVILLPVAWAVFRLENEPWHPTRSSMIVLLALGEVAGVFRLLRKWGHGHE